jgi:hypothetical protein
MREAWFGDSANRRSKRQSSVIYIWLRGTVDWEDEEAFWAQVQSRFRPTAELWNSTFNVPFHLFRHRVREIAALNLSRVENVVLAEWEEIPDGERVVPVDDDDWFAPNLVEVLEREWRLERGITWTPSWIGVPTDLGQRIYLIRRGLLPFTPPHWTCDTNNYALVKGPGSRPLLASHVRASEWFDGPGREVVGRIRSQRLSIGNRTIASQTSLRSLGPRARRGEMTRRRLLGRFRRYRKLYRRRLRWGRLPDWARPYVARMAELMDELEPK